MKYYILDDNNQPVPTKDISAWGRMFESDQRRVGWTQVNSTVTVSTVFLGLDHRHYGKGPPLLFETMIFGGPLDQSQWRYSSWDEAQAGHAAACRKAKEALHQKGVIT